MTQIDFSRGQGADKSWERPKKVPLNRSVCGRGNDIAMSRLTGSDTMPIQSVKVMPKLKEMGHANRWRFSKPF